MVESWSWDCPALADSFCGLSVVAFWVAFGLSEEVGSLNVFDGSPGGVSHCGLGNGLPDDGLNLGGGRVALGFEGVEPVNLKSDDPTCAASSSSVSRMSTVDMSRLRFDLMG